MTSYEQALEVMASTPTVLGAILAAATPEALERHPSEKSWSAREVLNHLLHVESAVIGERVRLMVRAANPTFGSIAPTPARDDPREALEAWLAARAENLRMLRDLTPAQLERTGQHPRYGSISVREHVVEWAYHDLDHLRQLLGALQATLYPDIGPFQALYPKPE